MDKARFQQLIERIDQLNSQDPNHEVVEGVAHPREVVYAKRLTEWVLRLNPNASEALRIAARGQHLCRWTIPRDRYERNRKGYLRWREILKKFHADTVAALMQEAGYPEDAMQRVRALILKKQLETDPETQTLEDALCLVFLETQLRELCEKTTTDKMRDIIRKTWRKMSPRGRAAALQLPLGDAEKTVISQALSTEQERSARHGE